MRTWKCGRRPDGSDPEPMPADQKRCPQWRYETAVYVLGAMTSTERRRFQRHLRGCPACRNEVVWLAGLPGLLRRLSAADAEALAGHGAEPRASGGRHGDAD